MQFIQAKRLNNKLGVRDNRPYAIDKVEFVKGGFALFLTSFEGDKVYLSYNDIEWFKRDFAIVDSIYGLERYRKLYGEEAETS